MDDAAFKKLFSHPRMIELLIRRHIPKWANRINYSTLERLPTELIDEHLRRRYPDTVWRARTIDGSTDLLLLLEFQGRPERRMALRTTIYSTLAVQDFLQHDRGLDQADRELAVASVVLHHGERPWNAPTRLSELFRDSAPDTYQVVSRLPPGTPPSGPLDLPQAVLGLAGVSTAAEMRTQLPLLKGVVEACEDEDFDRFMAHRVRAMLFLKGVSGEQLEEATTMGAIATAFQRSLDDIRREGRQEGQARLLHQLATRKFGPEIADELQQMLKRTSDPEQISRIAAAVLDCDAASDFLARARGVTSHPA